MISPAAYYIIWLHTGKIQTMAAIIRGLSKQKVLKIFNWEKGAQRCYERQLPKSICGATIPPTIQ